MKITEMPHWWSRTPQAQAEMDSLVAELKRKYPPKPRPVKPDGMSEADFILSLQDPSTQRVLKMTDEEAEAHRNRPMLTMSEVAANKDAYENYLKDPTPDNYKKFVGGRDLTPDEIQLVEALRRRPKNSTGQSEGTATPKEARDKAAAAFIFTPPAKVTKAEVDQKAVNLVQYKSEPMTEVWREMTWWQALVHRIKGNKIKSDETR